MKKEADINDLLVNFVIKSLDMDSSADKAYQKLIDDMRTAINLDEVFVRKVLPDNKGYVTLLQSCKDDDNLVDKTKVVPVTINDDYSTIVKALNEHVVTISEGVYNNGKFSSTLRYSFIRDANYYDGALGFRYYGPHNWTEEERTAIKKLGRILQVFVESSRLKDVEGFLQEVYMTDKMTNVRNNNGYERLLAKARKNIPQAEKIGVLYADLNGLKQANDTIGHHAGNKLLKGAADMLRKVFFAKDVYRIGGDEFLAIKIGIEEEVFMGMVKTFNSALRKDDEISMSVGYTWTVATDDIDALVKSVDKKMYRKKRAYHKEHDTFKPETFNYLAKTRYSCKKFSKKQLTNVQLNYILEAGRLAPTAKNLQEHKIYVVQEEDLARIDKLTPCRYGAPTVLIVAYEKNNVFTYPGDKRNSGIEDATIVATHMMLAAANIDVESCWVNYFNPDEVAKEFGLPENEEVVMMLDLGDALDGAEPLPNHLSRKPLNETVKFL